VILSGAEEKRKRAREIERNLTKCKARKIIVISFHFNPPHRNRYRANSISFFFLNFSNKKQKKTPDGRFVLPLRHMMQIANPVVDK